MGIAAKCNATTCHSVTTVTKYYYCSINSGAEMSKSVIYQKRHKRVDYSLQLGKSSKKTESISVWLGNIVRVWVADKAGW